MLFSIGRNRVWYREKTEGNYKAWAGIADGIRGILPNNTNLNRLNSSHVGVWLLSAGNTYPNEEYAQYNRTLVVYNQSDMTTLVLYVLRSTGTECLYKSYNSSAAIQDLPWQRMADGGNAAMISGYSANNIFCNRGALLGAVNGNNIKTPGAYTCLLDGTQVNFPETGAGYGTLNVEGDLFITQTYHSWSSKSLYVRIRRDVNEEWQPWRRYVSCEPNGDIVAFKTS